MSVDTPRVTVEKRDGIGFLMFDNPARRNAITVGMWESIPRLLEEFAADAEVRVVMLRGAGDVAFISGADISEFDGQRSDAQALAHYDAIARLAQERLYDFAKPTVAAIRGFCFGAGISLAVCCDVRIASQSARFSIPAGKLGLGYRAAGVKKLVDLVGPARTMDLFYTANQWSATQALGAGLVEHVVANEEFDAFAGKYGSRVAELAPLTLAAVKVAAREIMRAGPVYDHEMCERLVMACYTSEDYAEGRAAFREKRKPVFRGL
jgi:enoyl-CoA hydratase/carnithine racemase